MKTETQTTIKSEILSNINKGIQKLDDLIEESIHDENTLMQELNNLVALGILTYDKKQKIYKHKLEPTGDKIILEGNILLPVTVIRYDDKTLVCRGLWYELPPNFDVNRIIWNVPVQETNNSTLVDLLQLTQNKMKKTKIKQLDEYKQLVNLIIPYNDKLKFIINTVGKDLTSIVLLFTHNLYITDDSALEFRGFKVNSEISTDELIDQLKRKTEDRAWEEIKINRIFNFSDFIISKNQIPYYYDGKTIEYAELTRIRGNFKITYYRENNNGKVEFIDEDNFDNVDDGLEKIKEIFGMYVKEYLESLDIEINL